MPSHRWDPGIDGGVVLGKRNHKGRSKGISFRGSSSNLRCCGSGTGNWFKRIFWKSRTSAKWISILAIIPVNSHDYLDMEIGDLRWLNRDWGLGVVNREMGSMVGLIKPTTENRVNHRNRP
ncbi:hypothetical protein Bca4012_032969 [Brassica carinata]